MATHVFSQLEKELSQGAEIISRICQMLLSDDFYRDQLLALMRAPEDKRHLGVSCRMEDLTHCVPELMSRLATDPESVLTTIENALREVQQLIFNELGDFPVSTTEAGLHQVYSCWCSIEGGDAYTTRQLSGGIPCANIFPCAIYCTSQDKAKLSPKNAVHARMSTLYRLTEYIKPNISCIRSEDQGHFIQVTGTVTRTSQVRMVERQRFFRCANDKCGWLFGVAIEVEHDNTLNMPRTCPSPQPDAVVDNDSAAIGDGSSGYDGDGGDGTQASFRRGSGRGGSSWRGRGGQRGGGGGGRGAPRRCTSTNFVAVDVEAEAAAGGIAARVTTDYQEIRIQEPVQSLAVGSIPRSIVVVLEDDLVDSVKAGDDVTVTGTVLHRWSRVSRGKRCDLEMLIRANHVRVATAASSGSLVSTRLIADFDDYWAYFRDEMAAPLRGRDALVASICPQLHGLAIVKLVRYLCIHKWYRAAKLCGASRTLTSFCTSHCCSVGRCAACCRRGYPPAREWNANARGIASAANW